MVQCIIDLIKRIFFIAFYLGVCQAQNSISGFSDNSSNQQEEENNINIDPEFNVDAFPNPASTQLTIQSNENVQIQIKSTSGKIIETYMISNSGTLDISTLPVGIYFVEIHGESGQHTSKKILIQR